MGCINEDYWMRNQLLEELAGTPEYDEFIAMVDVHSTDCLLTKAW